MKAKNVLMVVAQNGFRDEELEHPKTIFKQKGANVLIAAEKKAPAKGMLGASITPDYSIKEAAALKFDALVIVGGQGAPEHLWGNSDLISMVRAHNADGKPLGAICLAPVVLARAGVLKEIEATVYKTTQTTEELKAHGVKTVPGDVVVSGSIVTANGPAAARKFALSLCEIIF